jgi:hypothetical protein
MTPRKVWRSLARVWRSLVRRHIVDDVPDEMTACFNCDSVRCSEEKYEACPNRLAQLAELRAAQNSLAH